MLATGHELEYVKIYFIMVLSIVAFSWSEKCTPKINLKKKKAFYEILSSSADLFKGGLFSIWITWPNVSSPFSHKSFRNQISKQKLNNISCQSAYFLALLKISLE